VGEAGVHEADGAGRAKAAHGVLLHAGRRVVVDGAGEDAVVPDGKEVAAVGAGRDFEGAVLLGDVVDHQKRGDDVAVGMRGEAEVLVPLHLGRGTGQLRVDLGVVELDIGANEVGAGRLVALAAREGIDRHLEVTAALLSYGERRMTAAIMSLPDGVFRFEDVMEWRGRLLPIVVAVEIDGGRLLADFAGTAGQIEGNINAVEAVTRSCLYYAVRVATDPTIPTNGGCYRPLSLSAPPGSLTPKGR